MRSMRRTFVLGAIAVLCLAGGLAGSAAAPGCGVAFAEEDKQEKAKKSVDAKDVYFGDANNWEKAAEVDPDKIYAQIDEYKEIKDKGLKAGDPKYEILMCKANKKFACAVKKTAKNGGYDLVAKIGAVKNAGTVPDVTADTIANL